MYGTFCKIYYFNYFLFNFYSINFSWILPLMSLGQKKLLDENDLYEPLQDEKTEFLTNKLERLVFSL